MRIAQVAPLTESVPPKLYGGTERVVSYLSEELVRQGHHVTLFASGDSVTSAKLIPIVPQALRLSRIHRDPMISHLLELERVFAVSDRFDIIHFHVDYLHFPLARRYSCANLTTLHGRLDIPDLVPFFREFAETPVVSISDSQRTPLPWANWAGTVHHGLPKNLYQYHSAKGEYLAFLGRICPEKGIEEAIQIATLAGKKLIVAAKVDPADKGYFTSTVEPLFRSNRLVEYIGEVNEHEKNDFLGNASALLLPLNWPEPFGLVMIEALACGTPVIAFPRGSVREIIDAGKTGFVVSGIEQAVKAVGQIDSIDRRVCRTVFETRFTSDRMASDYLRLYREIALKGELSDGRFVGTARGDYPDPGSILRPGDLAAE